MSVLICGRATRVHDSDDSDVPAFSGKTLGPVALFSDHSNWRRNVVK